MVHWPCLTRRIRALPVALLAEIGLTPRGGPRARRRAAAAEIARALAEAVPFLLDEPAAG